MHVKPAEKAASKPAAKANANKVDPKSDSSDRIDVALQARKEKKGELTEAYLSKQ